MNVNQFLYHIREGFRSITSHGLMSFAATCMIVACLLIMGSFSLVAVNMEKQLSDLEDENQFLAYVDDSLSEVDARALQATIEGIPNVTDVTFVSREDALAAYQEGKDEAYFADLPSDTLRHRYEIHLVNIELMDETVAQVEGIGGIADTRAEYEIAEGFVLVRNVASILALVLVVMLVVISLFIIANTIRLTTFTRRDEIAIMKMCGATDWFIRWPFIVEGIILGLLGGLVAFLLQWGIYEIIYNAIGQMGNLSFISAIPFYDLSQTVLWTFLLSGFLIGASGSVLAIRKFLRV